MSVQGEIQDSSVKEDNIWLRGLFMVFYIFVARVVEVVVVMVAFTQFFFKLFTKSPNAQLTAFGESLSTYIAEIVRFQTFNTEERPFPFSPWPTNNAGKD